MNKTPNPKSVAQAQAARLIREAEAKGIRITTSKKKG